ncbi:MAG: HU family DNA-binding protein, partial [Atopobiaceae bacterium]|nr:HU family DNA-binding protein [Atopobiaceae bacterium]
MWRGGPRGRAQREALKTGEKVVLPGFGMFGVRMRPARRG